MNRVVRPTAMVFLLGLACGLASACQLKGGPVRVNKVAPAEGISGGGDQVFIHGSGFQAGKTQVEVRFGRRKAEQVVISANNKIAVVTPAGDRGPVDVTVSFDDGATFKIADGFRYVAPEANQNVREAFFSGKPGEPKK